jgi:hypothetical protein
MTYNIFYNNTTKAISWVTNADCDENMISDQADAGLSHMTLELEEFNICDNHYINSTEDGIVEYSTFNPTVSATSIQTDGTSTISNIPEGTELEILRGRDIISNITMNSDESLTLTGTMPGTYFITFKKDKYYQNTITITVEGQT